MEDPIFNEITSTKFCRRYALVANASNSHTLTYYWKRASECEEPTHTFPNIARESLKHKFQ